MRFPERKLYPCRSSLSATIILSFAVLLIFTPEPGTMQSTHTLLCLGDSYTIGESVLPAENFPNQTVSLLRKDGYAFEDPEIVAKTGWTTDELQDAIDKHSFKDSYDFVTLLIGVNNQYRGRTVEDYRPGFESLSKAGYSILQTVKQNMSLFFQFLIGVLLHLRGTGTQNKLRSKLITTIRQIKPLPKATMSGILI